MTMRGQAPSSFIAALVSVSIVSDLPQDKRFYPGCPQSALL